MRVNLLEKRVLGTLCSITLAMGSIVMASPASAETINITIPSPPSPAATQSISVLDTQGISFTGPSTRTCISQYQPWLVIDASNSTDCGPTGAAAYLEINVPRGEGFGFSYAGCAGSCSGSFDVVYTLLGSPVGSDAVNIAASSTYTRSIEFDQVRIDTTTSDILYFDAFSFEVSPAPTSSAWLPAPLLQGVALPSSGDCTDVDESQLSWAAAIAGGWSKSWQSWHLSADSEVEPWQGWACIRTLGWTSRGWTPIN
jgi:hypothetical protein